ncbi:MAG: ComEC/Rec2 family competence protein [Patescibacteria group bacterium]|jgi:competence protein ComEC
MKKRIIISLIGLGLIIGIFRVLSLGDQVARVIFLDVGQGDAALIRTPEDKLILIDGGPDKTLLLELGKYLSFYERELEAVIISHWHDDHIVGLVEILLRFRVVKLIYPAGTEKNIITDLIIDLARQQGTEIIPLSSRGRLDFSQQCFMELLNPLSLGAKEDGNNSLTSRLSCQGQKFLFSGDNELGAEEALLKSNFNLLAEVFKASHHGSKTSNSQEFLEAVRPQVVVVSAGRNNRYNHPAPVVLERFYQLGLKVLRTDQLGSIPIKISNFP